jgi:hypothetical protein
LGLSFFILILILSAQLEIMRCTSKYFSLIFSFILNYKSQAESNYFILNKSGSVKLAEVANNLFPLQIS